MKNTRYKTFIINRGTKKEEYYGYKIYAMSLRRFSGDTPLTIMPESITWDKIIKTHPEKDFSNVSLVTIEINIID